MRHVRQSRQHDRTRSADGHATLGLLSDEQVVQALAAAGGGHDPARADALAGELERRLLQTRALEARDAEGAFALDADEIVTFVDPAMVRLLGGGEDEYMGRRLDEVLVLRDAEGRTVTRGSDSPIGRCISTRSPVAWEGRLARPGGPDARVAMTVAPFLRGGVLEGVVVTLREAAARDAADPPRGRLHEVLEHMPNGVTLVEAPSGRVLFHNAQAVRILGHPPADVGRAPEPAGAGPLHADGRLYGHEETPLARALGGEAVKAHLLDYRRGDGRVTRLLVSAAPVRDASGALVAAVGVCVDVAEAPRIGGELPLGEARLHDVLGSLREGIFLFDREGEVVFASGPASEILGVPPADLCAMRPADAPLEFRTADGTPIPPEKTPVGIALEQGKPVRDACLRVTTPHRGARDFVVSAVPTADGGVVASFEDVTEEMDAQRRLRESREALRRSEAQYRALVENSPEPMAVQVDGRFRFINRAGASLFGADAPERLIGRDVLDFVQPGSLARVKARTADLRAGADVQPTGEERIVRLDGRVVEVEMAAVRIVYEGEPAVQVLFRDISHRKAHQRELERRVDERTAELQRALGDLETFSETASHDLRAPLRRVGVLLDDLLEALAGPDLAEAAELAGRARRENAKAQRLVRDLLGFARSGKAELRPVEVDVSAMAREIIQDVEQAHPDRRTTWRIQPGIRVRADAGLLRLALHNLLDNASKYSSKGGASVVSLSRRAGDGGDVLLVEDNGVGFPMEEAARLFQPFARLSTAQGFEGTGLGLATVHRVATRHGGRVWAESRPAAGATFHLSLPRGEPPRRGA